VLTKKLIEQELTKRLGQPVTSRIIEGTTDADWERTKRKDAEAKRLQEIAASKFRAELTAKTNWEGVYEQLGRKYAAVQNRTLPQNRARFLKEAIEMVAEARKQQEGSDEVSERNFARCLERVAQYTEVPSAFVAVQVMEK